MNSEKRPAPKPLESIHRRFGRYPTTPFPYSDTFAALAKAINHEVRQNILAIITECQPICAKDIYIRIRGNQAVTSQNLDLLRQAGLIKKVRSGKNTLYSIDVAGFQVVMEIHTVITRAFALKG